MAEEGYIPILCTNVPARRIMPHFVSHSFIFFTSCWRWTPAEDLFNFTCFQDMLQPAFFVKKSARKPIFKLRCFWTKLCRTWNSLKKNLRVNTSDTKGLQRMIFMKQVSVDDVKLKVAFENGSKNNKKGVKCPESVTPQLPHLYNFFLGNMPKTVRCICQLRHYLWTATCLGGVHWQFCKALFCTFFTSMMSGNFRLPHLIEKKKLSF